MSSTTVVKYNQCVSERSVSFKPIKFKKSQCPIHPSRANCRAIKAYDPVGQTEYSYHFTFIEGYYKQYDGVPYYMGLLSDSDVEMRGKLDIADQMACYVRLDALDTDETFYTIDEAGERNMAVLKTTLKALIDFARNAAQYYVLMFDEPQIDLLFSVYRTVLLPQRVYTLFKTEAAPAHDAFDVFSVPDTPESIESQNIYKTFLIYNTMLTMVLKQRNPFNAHNKNISVVFRSLGTCPNNSRRVKCCDLKYGGNAPGHFMCPTREIVRRVFKYAKWAKNPNNYKRYYELIMRPIQRERRYVRGGAAQSFDELDLIVLDWYNFIEDFKTYFLG